MQKKYFEGFDVIRTLAALLVVVHHIELSIHREFGHGVELGVLQNAAVHIIDMRGVHIFLG